MKCGEERNIDKYSFSNSRGIWHPFPWPDACFNLENTRMNTWRLNKKPRLLSLWPFPHLHSVRRATGNAQEGSPLSRVDLPPQWVLPLESAGSPTEGPIANMSDRVVHLTPPLKQLAFNRQLRNYLKSSDKVERTRIHRNGCAVKVICSGLSLSILQLPLMPAGGGRSHHSPSQLPARHASIGTLLLAAATRLGRN